MNKSKSAVKLDLHKMQGSETGSQTIQRHSFEKLPSGRGVSSVGLSQEIKGGQLRSAMKQLDRLSATAEKKML